MLDNPALGTGHWALAGVLASSFRLPSAYCPLPSSLPFQQSKFVHIDAGLAAVERNDNGQPDCHLSRRHGQRKEDEDLSSHIVEVFGEGDEVDIGRVQ